MTTKLKTEKNKRYVQIGTSNIVIPGNKLTFPPAFRAGSRLHYYGSLFNSVELNSTFYKTPKKETFEKWAAEVPEDFTFSIKLSKTITHAKNLVTDFKMIDDFMLAAAGLGKKKGCLLIQFPGKIDIEYFTIVEDILAHLDQFDGNFKWRKAVEFRNSNWYLAETYEMLNEFNTALVMHDIPKSTNDSLLTKAPLAYLRFHGEAGNYRGSYPDTALKIYAGRIRKWRKAGVDTFAYFNNTIGSAFENAQTLQKMINEP